MDHPEEGGDGLTATADRERPAVHRFDGADVSVPSKFPASCDMEKRCAFPVASRTNRLLFLKFFFIVGMTIGFIGKA
jgi:hypothetical protein